ncbi:MAG: hypothetical protein AAFR04_14900, partial [Pseudomonadota bacterium]
MSWWRYRLALLRGTVRVRLALTSAEGVPPKMAKNAKNRDRPALRFPSKQTIPMAAARAER